MVPNQEAMAIRVKNTHKYNDMCGRTAVIPCLNGFTAEVRETHLQYSPCNFLGFESDPWGCYLALVPKDFKINYCSRFEVNELTNKDDPTKKIFGIRPCRMIMINVKKISWSDFPPQDDVIHIRYDKQERTVSFKCSTFEYR